MYFMIKWLIINFLAQIFTTNKKFVVLYIPIKICKHSLTSIDFIVSVYKIFENPSYIHILRDPDRDEDGVGVRESIYIILVFYTLKILESPS